MIISLVDTATVLVYLLRSQHRSIYIDISPTSDAAEILDGVLEAVSGTTQVCDFLQQ